MLAQLYEDFDIEHLSMRDMLQTKKEDPSYLHAEFVRFCFDEGVECPSQLKVDLLGQHIEVCARAGRKGFLIEGFPNSTSELDIFEANVGSVGR